MSDDGLENGFLESNFKRLVGKKVFLLNTLVGFFVRDPLHWNDIRTISSPFFPGIRTILPHFFETAQGKLHTLRKSGGQRRGNEKEQNARLKRRGKNHKETPKQTSVKSSEKTAPRERAERREGGAQALSPWKSKLNALPISCLKKQKKRGKMEKVGRKYKKQKKSGKEASTLGEEIEKNEN